MLLHMDISPKISQSGVTLIEADPAGRVKPWEAWPCLRAMHQMAAKLLEAVRKGFLATKPAAQ
jgi:hypothetical protein